MCNSDYIIYFKMLSFEKCCQLILESISKEHQGLVVQSVASPIADPGVMSSISAWLHTFMEIDREIFSTVIFLGLLIQEWLLSVTSKSICTED